MIMQLDLKQLMAMNEEQALLGHFQGPANYSFLRGAILRRFSADIAHRLCTMNVGTNSVQEEVQEKVQEGTLCPDDNLRCLSAAAFIAARDGFERAVARWCLCMPAKVGN
jgi:hypothetical protein